MYRQKLDGYILPAIGNSKMEAVSNTDLQAIVNLAAGMSTSTAKKIHIVIHAMFAQAEISGVIVKDPSRSLTIPATTAGKRRSLTDDERRILIDTADYHRCGTWILTLLATGMRPAESQAVKIGDFNLSNRLLTISRSVESGSGAVSTPKTDAGVRVVPIPEALIPRLMEAFAGKKPNDFAFPQTDGSTMMTTECVSNNWRSYKRAMQVVGGAITVRRGRAYSLANDGYDLTLQGRVADIDRDGFDGSVVADDLILYDLRHTYCTDLQRAGVPINVARYLMGHADISTTSSIYTHTGTTDAENAGKQLDEYYSKPDRI